MAIEPYLFFNGRCEEAIEFYKKALGAEVLMLMRYKESPEPTPPGMVPPGWENKIMHATLRIGDREARGGPDPRHLAMDASRERTIGGRLEHREFDTRRAGIDDEDWFIHRFQISSRDRGAMFCIWDR